MMQALATLGDEPGNRRILRSGLEQLQAALAHRNHYQPHLLLLDSLFRRGRQPQLLIDRLGRRQRLHRDAEMIDGNVHKLCHFESSEESAFRSPLDAPAISSTSVYGSRLCSATSAAKRDRFPSPSCSRAFSSMASRNISTRRFCQFSMLFFSCNFSFSRYSSYWLMASASSCTPFPSLATVFTIGGVQPSCRVASDCSARISRSTRSAPSRSLLLITKISAISMMPALIVCTSSPMPGTRITTVTSARRTISTSSWPTPTVSMSTRSRPEASSTVATSAVVPARPPSEPRVAMLRI